MDEAQVSQAVLTARDLLTKTNLDPDSPLGVAAFKVMLERLLADALRVENDSQPREQPREEDSPPSRIARWAAVSEEGLNDLFEFGSDGVEIQLPTRVLPTSKAARQRFLGLVKLAIDRVAYEREDISGGDVNALCERYVCLDQNLPNNLRNYENYISRRGHRGSYTYRITQPGLDASREVIRGFLNAG